MRPFKFYIGNTVTWNTMPQSWSAIQIFSSGSVTITAVDVVDEGAWYPVYKAARVVR